VALTPGARLGPYEIGAQIGAGGMGEVYRARDTKLKRDVAIKILPQHTASDADRRARFEREAQSIAALNHPNIVTIYSVEEADGVLFLTMELVDGQPLDGVISKSGLPLARILAVAIPLAEAISAAHQKGITHRDLKPANVMVTTDGRLKVLDFGLAKLKEPSPIEAGVSELPTRVLTGEGRIVGTVAYMSPEQAEGKPIDHRSDVFSLGVVLYELATGERPFTGDTSVSLLSSIIRDTPRSATELKPALPRDLSRIIKQCLVKDPEYRYQSAKDIRNELRALQQESESGELEASRGSGVDARGAVGLRKRRRATLVATGVVLLLAGGTVGGWLWFTRIPTGSPIESLAVLPFVNVGADPEAEYLSDGITENLINSLSQLTRLRVVPRSTVFRYKGRQLDLRAIGRELTVRAVLTGRVVQRGETLNIQTELVDVTEDAQLWGRQFDRTSADIIAVQEEIARAVSEQLRLATSTDEQKLLTRRPTENPEAHQLYLRGQYYWNRRTSQTLRRATDYFQQAIEKDPNYGLAWAALADCYSIYGFYGVESPVKAAPRAKDAAQRALSIDDTLAEAHSALGFTRFTYDWDWPAAESEFKRAIELDPDNGLPRQRLAMLMMLMGRRDEAFLESRRSREVEPLSSNHNAQHGRIFYHARQFDQALRELTQSLDLDPNYAQTHLYLGWVYEQQGKYADAIAQIQKGLDLSGGESEMAGALGHAFAAAGRRDEAEKLVAELKERSTRQYVAPFDIALIYAGLGEKNATFEWLNKAYEDRSSWFTWMAVDARFDGVRDDPRFRDLLRRMKIPE
jgi:TolB-like protein/Flp pilus assembly protein TadD